MAILDLTLPKHEPSVDRLSDSRTGLLPFALYTLVEISPDDLNQLVCNVNPQGEFEEELRDTVQLARPQHNFAGKALRTAYDCHLSNLRDVPSVEPEFNWKYFLVATENEWSRHGVLLVTLDDGSFPGRVDSIMAKADQVGMVLVNLRVGTINWDECQASLQQHSLDFETAGQNRDSDEPLATHSTGELEKMRQSRMRNATPFGIYPQIPPMHGPFIAVYAISGTDINKLIEDLEPDANGYTKFPAEYTCRAQNLEVRESQSSWSILDGACMAHPSVCTKAQFHTNYFLVADSTDWKKRGILLIYVDWDSDVADDNPEKLARNCLAGSRRVERVEYDQAYGNLRLITQGYRDFIYEHQIFAVFPVERCNNLPSLLDKKYARRGHGAESLVIAPYHCPAPEGEIPVMRQIAYDWPEVIRTFRVMCRNNRFRGKFNKHLFIVCVDADPTEKGVLLARLDWDEREVFEKEPEECRDVDIDSQLQKVTVQRCKVEEAYEKLVVIADGQQAENWQRLEL